MPCRRVLVLTGPPAVGKSTTARAVARGRGRCAVVDVDVDNVRQLVVSGGAAPWDGEEGLRQQRSRRCGAPGDVGSKWAQRDRPIRAAERRRRMSDLRERASSRVSSRTSSLPALVASLAATVVVLLGSLTSSVTDASAGQVLLTAAAVGLLTAVMARAGQRVTAPLPVRARPSGVAGAVPASTAYWCALDAPSCPQRPRAPGRH